MLENKFPTRVEAQMVNEDHWTEPFIKYLKYDELPKEKSLAMQLKKRMMRFILVNDVSHRRSYDQLFCCGVS